MLGLNRYITKLLPHNPLWLMYAQVQCNELKQALEDQAIDVQHVGSSAVPDLPAKPIIDIAVGLQDEADVSEAIARLGNMSYLYRGDTGESGGYLFVKETSPDIRSIHLHAVDYDGRQWRNYLLFRDTLRQDTVLRQQYANLKQSLARRFLHDREQYTNSKHAFIQSVLNRDD